MTPDELNALKTLAQAATPGVWEVYDADVTRGEHDIYIVGESLIGSVGFYTNVDINAAYIAAANPAAVMALIAEVERLHARDAIAAEVAAGAMDRAALIARIEALEAERAQVSAQMLQAKAELDDIAPRMATVLEHVKQLEAENARLRSIKVAAELARTQISSTETAYRVLNFALNTYKD